MCQLFETTRNSGRSSRARSSMSAEQGIEFLGADVFAIGERP
jgi:hypothetical protein